MITKYPKTFITSLLAVAVLLSHPSFAQDDDDVRQQVARVAFLSGTASFNRGDDPDAWEDAAVNTPMTVGDRLYTSRDGRAELQAHGARIYLGPESELAALDFREDIRQLSLTIGTASFRINRVGEGEVFEVDTPNVSLTFLSPGYYRVDVDRDGNTVASIFKGSAVAAAGGGEVDLQAGDAIRVDGLDEPRYDVTGLPRTDPWDRWVEERSRQIREGSSVRYASADIVGLDDLDREGEWKEIPDYGMVWAPPVTTVDWAPFRSGRWAWQDPWGWTWISQERWGWAPYHYGSWITWRDRWFWVPVPRSVVSVRYSPARVAFSGGGPGWESGGMAGGGGFVGWFPIGPRDRFVPWWGRRTSMGVTAIEAPFVNRKYVTVMNRDAFAGGRFVDREQIRDQRVIRQVSGGQVLVGRIPIVPTTASLRISARVDGGPVVRPPRFVGSRAVVTRVAPPPAPLPFQTKLGLITEGGGAPISRVVSEKHVIETRGQQRPVVNVRPALTEGGKVVLAPKRELVETRRVRPATVPDGRTPSTGDRPFVGAQPRDKDSRPPVRQEFQPPMGGNAIPRPDGGPAINKGSDRPVDRGQMERRDTPPRPDGGPAIRPTDRPADRPQPERRDFQPRPDTRPEVKPENKPENKLQIKPEPGPTDRTFDRPVDRGQPERRDVQPRPDTRPLVRTDTKPEARPEAKPEARPEAKPEARPENKPDFKPVQRNVDRPAEQIQPERRERPPRPEVKPADRPAAVVQPPPKVEQKPQPPVRIEKAPPAAPKAEKPAKPEDAKKDKDKKDR
jgi:hypothetical protein